MRGLRFLPSFLAAVAAAGAFAAAASACSSFEADAPGAPGTPVPEGGVVGEAGGLDGSLADGPGPASSRVCGIGAPFGAPEIVDVGGGTSIDTVRFSPDRSSGWIGFAPADAAARRAMDIAPIRITGKVVSIGLPSPFNAPNAFDSFPSPVNGTNKLVFTSNRAEGDGAAAALPELHLFLTDIDSATDASVVQLESPAGTSVATEPYVIPSGAAMYFSANPSNGEYNLYRAVREGDSFATNVAVPLLNVQSAVAPDQCPVVSDDEQEVFFATKRAGTTEFDVWTSRRRPGTDPVDFEPPSAVGGGVNTMAVEYPTWISPDACELYVVRKVSGLTQGYLYKISRARP